MEQSVEELAGKQFPLDTEEQALKARLEAWVSSPKKETRMYYHFYNLFDFTLTFPPTPK